MLIVHVKDLWSIMIQFVVRQRGNFFHQLIHVLIRGSAGLLKANKAGDGVGSLGDGAQGFKVCFGVKRMCASLDRIQIGS